MEETRPTKRCRQCASEIDKAAKICPTCKKPQVNPMTLVIAYAVIFISVFMIFTIILNPGNSNNNPGDINTVKDNLTIEGEVTQTADTHSLYFEGIIKNNTSREMGYVQITISLYDKASNLIGTALANVNNLKAGGTWKFKAMAFLTFDQMKLVKSWEVSDLTGF